MEFLRTTPLEQGECLYGMKRCLKAMKDGFWTISVENVKGTFTETAQLRRTLDNGARLWQLHGYGYIVPHPQMDGLYGVYRRAPDTFDGMGARGVLYAQTPCGTSCPCVIT